MSKTNKQTQSWIEFGHLSLAIRKHEAVYSKTGNCYLAKDKAIARQGKGLVIALAIAQKCVQRLCFSFCKKQKKFSWKLMIRLVFISNPTFHDLCKKWPLIALQIFITVLIYVLSIYLKFIRIRKLCHPMHIFVLFGNFIANCVFFYAFINKVYFDMKIIG